ncbi:pentapeptide repeat-containing protein [Geothrix sp. 21YS21S-2]|uniref:virginiamycin B lyase family protein n=1 Tax=Geothrix sp. 21YS21S-2 TaxID=3068893 RepID=UPI0027BB1E40|nr:pentapeptide repeat-containing protein [Geothrix sp. 21YS21S-2]
MRSLLAELKGFGLPDDRKEKEAPAVGGILHDLTLRGLHLRAGAGLRGADLRGADLRRLDLAGADLRGADLTRARLEGANLTGARLEGARLFCADIGGAIGLDLSDTRLHPFFEILEDEDVGHVKTLNLGRPGNEERGPVRNLAAGPDGRLFWTQGDHPAIENMTVTGVRHAMPPVVDTRIHALVADSRGRLWSVGDRMIGICSLASVSRAISGEPIRFSTWKMEIPARPNQVVAGSNGDLWVSLAERVCRISHDPASNTFGFRDLAFRCAGPAAGTLGMSGSNEAGIAFAVPEQERVFFHRGQGQPPSTFALPPGSRPRRLVPGQDGRLWFIQAGPPGIGEIGVNGSGCKVHLLDGPATQPHGIAPGPDGSMWFTDTAGERIGRIASGGRITWFPLPRGSRPQEIVPAPDGRMLFTLQGRSAIGSIRAALRPATRLAPGPVDRLAWEAAESKQGPRKAAALPAGGDSSTSSTTTSSWEVPVYHPRPVPVAKTPSREERHALHQRRLEAAEKALLARQALEPKEAPAPPPGPPTPAPEVPSIELDALLDQLETQAVLLAPGAVRHSQARHCGASEANGRWAAPFANPQALAALIARGMLASGAIAKVTAPDGGFETACESQEIVGTYRDCQGVHPTRWFRVITERHIVEDQEVQIVMTAYPIAEHWR